MRDKQQQQQQQFSFKRLPLKGRKIKTSFHFPPLPALLTGIENPNSNWTATKIESK